MGQLFDGKWSDEDNRPSDATGAFLRPSSTFRNWVTPDGSTGPTGEAGFPAEPGRYHLFIASNCPWAHRTAIFRKLKGLDGAISMSLADAPKAEGWSYTRGLDELRVAFSVGAQTLNSVRGRDAALAFAARFSDL